MSVANLCKALGLELWIDRQHDEGVQDQIRADLCTAFARKSRDEWVAELADKNTCLTPVYSIAELVEDPQFRHRGVIVEAEHPEHGRFRQLGATFAGQERPSGIQSIPDLAGDSDTFEVLAEIGISASVIEDLCSRGLVA